VKRIQEKIPDWVMGLGITLFFIFMALTGIFDFTEPLELKTFDLRAHLAASGERNPDIELVVISDDDLDDLGRFPWPRNILARGIRNLARAGARVIALNILFSEPEESAGLRAVRKLKEQYEALGLAQEGPGLSFYGALSSALVDLNNDNKLYRAMKEAGNVVLPVYFDTVSGGIDEEPPPFILHHALKEIKISGDPEALSYMIRFHKVKPLLPAFGEVAAGIGHFNLFQDRDGYVRHQVPVVRYLDQYTFPSLAVAIVRVFKGVRDGGITLIPGRGIRMKVGPESITFPVVDSRMRCLIRWRKGPGVAFHRTPFSRVYRNEFRKDLFRGKIVIIGLTAQGLEPKLVTPVAATLPGLEVVANSVADILERRFFTRPAWAPLLELFVLLVFGLHISFVLPRMKAGMGAITTFTLFLLYGLLGSLLFFSRDLWLKITSPMLLLLVGYLLVVSKRFLVTERAKDKVEADSIETNKMLGLSFQQQGMLDLALEKFRKLPLEEEGVKDLLYNLGLDFERKRQFSKALATYRLIVGDGKAFKDLAERIPRLKGAEATLIFGTRGVSHPGDIGADLTDSGARPTLGRYEIVDELGRGAMGVVYKGEDPKIHRTVAIKTLRLSDFEDNVVEEVKERFFREAESAGLLTHPNIVTIYDCGEEQDLAYIAMEYLDGETLEEFARKDRLLPVRETLSIVAQVAEALDYAHGRGVVHRDVKPANIMRLRDHGFIKVTDFGIARITSSSKTKTGVVLGTPSYMSPEQISGKKVDGRSDIFSLGIVLFEMLTGQKPFEGEDLTALMYQIAREPHPGPRSINPRIPPVVEKIIGKALKKDPAERYQRASQMAAHLLKVIAKMDEIAAKKEGGPTTRKPTGP